MITEDIRSFIKHIYKNFNERNIDLVIANMTIDVQWATGMDGGYVYGRNNVRTYWTKQFSLVSSKVTPLQIDDKSNVVKIKVHQVVHDVNGNLLADEIVYHLFTLKDGTIARFDIGDKNQTE